VGLRLPSAHRRDAVERSFDVRIRWLQRLREAKFFFASVEVSHLAFDKAEFLVQIRLDGAVAAQLDRFLKLTDRFGQSCAAPAASASERQPGRCSGP